MQLAAKWLDGRCTDAEEIELFNYYEQYGEDNFQLLPTHNGDEAFYRDILLDKINKKIKRKPVFSMHLIKWASAAAIILVIGTLLINRYKTHSVQHVKLVAQNFKHKTLIQNEAVLIQNDGKIIKLGEAGKLHLPSDLNIHHDSSGTLVYRIAKQAEATDPKLINEIRTPAGQTLIVYLSDGTKVHLNAASSLKFPGTFTSASRKVFLSGEAYFEVTKNKTKPFIVSTANQEVEVLGTHFNVNAYDNEADSRTTLIEGSVKIHPKHFAKSSILIPGQQAVLGKQILSVTDVDPNGVLAWRGGYFLFNNEDLESIMRKLERVYGIEVIYKTKKNPELTFAGRISQQRSLTSILKILSETGDVSFSVSGRKVVVLK